MSKRLSPFSKEFWMARGLSEEDAQYKCSSFNPTRKEHWLEKGYSLEDAIKKAEEVKWDNIRKGAAKQAQKKKEDYYESSPRRPEYWMKKGYSYEESVQKVSEAQTTFSLEKCIQKHGVTRGYEIWKARQDKWQNTLNNKSPEEIADINKRKSTYRMNLFASIDECIEVLANTRNMTLFKDVDEFRSHVIEQLRTNPYLKYYPVKHYIEKKLPKVQLQIFEELSINIEEVLKDLIIGDGYESFLMRRGKKQATRMWTDEGLLRSSYEIYFYEKFKSKFPDLTIEVDKPYENSSFRYDFGINNVRIEICPMYDSNEKYKAKMDKKRNSFGCILLKNIDEIDHFIENFVPDEKHCQDG